ncbi:MAG: hypothetical protein IJ123_10315 [Blautia sp.]|nr:hypothetical protein [Blautia sp.]
MDNSIFRKKSIEQLSAPEQLTSYLKVTGPGVWVVLTGVIVLLAGMFFWGVFGTIISSVSVPTHVKDGVASVYVLTDDLNQNDPEVDVSIGDVEFTAATDTESTTMNASDDKRLYESGYLSPGKNVNILTGETSLADGFYNADVTIERIKPISLLFAQN